MTDVKKENLPKEMIDKDTIDKIINKIPASEENDWEKALQKRSDLRDILELPDRLKIATIDISKELTQQISERVMQIVEFLKYSQNPKSIISITEDDHVKKLKWTETIEGKEERYSYIIENALKVPDTLKNILNDNIESPFLDDHDIYFIGQKLSAIAIFFTTLHTKNAVAGEMKDDSLKVEDVEAQKKIEETLNNVQEKLSIELLDGTKKVDFARFLFEEFVNHQKPVNQKDKMETFTFNPFYQIERGTVILRLTEQDIEKIRIFVYKNMLKYEVDKEGGNVSEFTAQIILTIIQKVKGRFTTIINDFIPKINTSIQNTIDLATQGVKSIIFSFDPNNQKPIFKYGLLDWMTVLEKNDGMIGIIDIPPTDLEGIILGYPTKPLSSDQVIKDKLNLLYERKNISGRDIKADLETIKNMNPTPKKVVIYKNKKGFYFVGYP